MHFRSDESTISDNFKRIPINPRGQFVIPSDSICKDLVLIAGKYLLDCGLQ